MKATHLVAMAIHVVLATILTACGGSGGSSDEPPGTSVGNISGVAFDSELAGAEVYVSRYDGLFYGKAVTDSEGRFSIDVKSDSQVIRIETKGGSFVDEFTGKTYQEMPGQNDGGLRLYLNYDGGSSRVVAPTLYSTLAADLADYLIEKGADPAAAVSQANGTFSAILGIDIETTIPHNVTREPGTGIATSSIEYGFLCAGISALVAQSGQRPIEFNKIAGNDIANDGLLDDVGPASSASLELDGKGYRHALALGILRMATSARNRTGWNIDDVLPLAQRLNASTDPVFGATAGETTPLDTLKPVISGLSWWYGDIYFDTVVGTVELTFSAADTVGIEAIDVVIGDQRYAIADVKAPSVSVNTAGLPDGVQPVVITARNVLGTVTTHQSSIRIANQGLAIVDMYPGNGQAVAGNVAFSARVTDPTGIAVVDFLIDGNRIASPSSGDVRTANYFTPQLNDGAHTFAVRATNGVGIIQEQTVAFRTDNTAPVIDFWFTPGTYLEKIATLWIVHDEDSNVVLTLNGTELPRIDRVLHAGKAFSSFQLDTQQYADADYVLVAQASDSTGNDSAREINMNIDNTPPVARFISPTEGDYVVGEFNLRFEASDVSGFGEKPFEILVDGVHSSWVSNTWRSNTVNAAIYGRGWHKVTLVVEDASGKMTTISQNIYFDI